ncbi:PLC-like phosphodiesterase [Pholiota conissans]|uniref:PLC-like phosphodiesterase n=1 Tax=Pholiota conissans TaxID=109636 RepID=A0A9P5Z7L1_9AGAR|nr:PLC-like phosphodiesterase [Pholiota conissans]
MFSLLCRSVLLALLSSAVFTAEGHPYASSSSPSALASETLGRRATVCNGHAELCDKTFGTVTFVGAHDSYAIGVNNVATNQDQSITQQLNDGIRMLQMQAHNQNGVIRLCHTSCSLFDGGSLQDYLTLVKQWLDANPNEVLSLLIVNIDNLPPANYDTVFKAVGLDAVSYAPSSSPIAQTSWPTLGSMIDSGKRLLTFLDNAADLTAVPYLMDEFSNIWETEFNVVDPSFNCDVNRTHSTDPTTQMFLINHFLDKIVLGVPVPFVAQLNVTNAASGAGSLGAQVDTCKAAHGRAPNFLLVDFYEYGAGSVFQVAAGINGVTYSPTSPIAAPKSTSSGTSTSGSSQPTTSVTTSSLSGATSNISTNPLFTYIFSAISLMLGSLIIF